jgi:hypothetical protein
MLHLQVPPQPGQILVGYETCQPVGGCCVCDGLSAGGVIAIVILVLVFWPLAWIPCVMPGANLGCFAQPAPSSLAQRLQTLLLLHMPSATTPAWN